MEMKGKVIVVTGGGSGIGAALVRRFAREGAAGLVVADLDGARAEAVAAEVGGLAVRTDVSQETEVQALIDRATAQFGRVDVLCSNAGIALGGGPAAPDDDWQRSWDVNVMAHVWGARAVLPQMLARGEGYLLQAASAAGLLSHPESATYAVSKHAAVAFAEWLAMNHGDQGIRVSCLCPQGVNTNMLNSGDLTGDNPATSVVRSAGAVLEPAEVADVTLDAITEERFLVLPHPEVLTYLQRKAADPARWLAGMRKLQARMADPA